jgi:6-phosphofructokinase 1
MSGGIALKRIAVLTSGGDAPGMNAAVRAVTRTAIGLGAEVVGVQRGYQGLINGDFIELKSRSVGDILQRGGTMIKTARSEEFRTIEGRTKAMLMMKSYQIEGLVGIGGDGTYRGLAELVNLGFPVIGVPGTIDNDIASTDYTIGFDTACNTVIDAINKIRDTASSHDRTFVIEVMGMRCGDIALHTGLAGGAEEIIIPEIHYDIDKACARIEDGVKRGKGHSIIVVAEGIIDKVTDSMAATHGSAYYIADQIRKRTGMEFRVIVLGHVQRGGSPTVRDRVLATRLGAKAAELLISGVRDAAVGIKDDVIVHYPLHEALAMEKHVNMDLYGLVNEMSI